MLVGELTVLVMVPNDPEATLPLGTAKAGWLSRLKAEGCRVLVGDGTPARRPGSVVEEIVGVQNGVVVVLGQVAVKLVGTGFSDEVHLYAGHAAVLCTVRVEDHGGFGDLVGPEIGRASCRERG